MVVDTGVLLAAADRKDPDHDRCVACMAENIGRLITTDLVVAETGWSIDAQLGGEDEATFYRLLVSGAVRREQLTDDDLARVAELTEKYADFPLGGVDSSIVAVAERLGLDTVATLDHRHFRAVRPNHIEAFKLIPE